MTYYKILAVFISWSIFYSLHSFLIEFKHTSAAYAKFLSTRGLSINIFQLKWYTVRCNRLFIRISNKKPNFLKIWFNLGVLAGIVGQAFSVLLLLYTLFDHFRKKPQSEQILVPVLPGVNLPADQTLYYFLALFICGICHEFGHAIAASREQVRVNGFGVFIMLIFPGAYVDLCSDHLKIISPIRQLRIFCGGVWHNLVIVLVAVSCIQVHPYFLGAFFTRGVYVNSISRDSALNSMISIDSVISSVDTCHISDRFTFYECLFKLDSPKTNQVGYCMPISDIQQFSLNYAVQKLEAPGSTTDLTECCNATAANYCFKWLKPDQEIFNRQKHYSCLPARYVTEQNPCLDHYDCAHTEPNSKTVCIKAVSDNSTRLVKITHDKGDPVLYVGSIKELIYSIKIDEFRPKFRFIPSFLNHQLLLLLKYIVAFSGAIGILNLVPCFALDGQYILAALIQLISKRDMTVSFIDLNRDAPSEHPVLYAAIMTFGTGLLILNMLLAFLNVLF